MMTPTCPMEQREVVDRYFLEHRAKLLDIAAFLDRIDRCKHEAKDYRIIALHECIKQLLIDQPNRAEKILHILSDQTTIPIESAGTKGASGTPIPHE